MQQNSRSWSTFACAVLLGLAPLTVAHGHDEEMKMDMGEPAISRPTIPLPSASAAGLGSYFQYGEHSGLMFAHILLMVVAWVFVLPVGECVVSDDEVVTY